jgi:hypothetical protein
MSNIFSWLLQNWYLIIIGIIVLSFIVNLIIKFFKLPIEQRYKKIRQWLLWMVVQAEIELGSGTGQLKLHMVYDAFISKFPIASKFMSFEKFSQLVDSALDEMKELLNKNEKIQAIVTK